MGGLEVRDVFKVAWIWFKTGIRPELLPDKGQPGKIVFTFPDTPEVRGSIHDFLNDVNGIKSFVEHYRLVRGEMYLKRDKGKNGTEHE